MTTTYIAWLTLREVSRKRLVWVGLALGLAFLALYAVGFSTVYGEFVGERPRPPAMMQEMASFFAIAALYGANFLIVMISVLASVDTISGEVASHSIQSIVTKPLRRWEVVLGKWLGFALLIAAETLLLAGGVVLISRALSGYLIPNAPQAMALMALAGLILLSLTLAGGTRFSTLTNGVLVFMLFGLAFLGGWTEQVGAAVGNNTAIRLGIASSLVLPTEALWKRAAYLMQPATIRDFGITPFTVTSVPNAAMVWYALLYGLAALALAVRTFSRKDL